MGYYDTANPGGGGEVLELTPAVKQAHLAAIVGGQPLVGLTSIAELREFPVADCFPGRQVSLACHTVEIDIGGGIFIWSSITTENDNNGTIICPNGYVGLGRWIRLEALYRPAFVSIGWFGARQNTPGFDNGPIINAAIQCLPLYASTAQVINGGYMRSGSCYIPPGVWYVSESVVASGGMRLFGEGPQKSAISMNPNIFTDATPKTISAVPSTSPGATIDITVTAHGKTVGHWVSGWLKGISGSGSKYLNRWQRMKVMDPNTLRIQFGASGSYTVSSATVDFDNWVCDFQIDTYNITVNNTFATVCTDLAFYGNAVASGNIGTSGLNIEGAQQSYVFNLIVADVGIIGTRCDVPADKIWVPNQLKGPGYMALNGGVAMDNGLLAIEHTNQDALHTLELIEGGAIPRPAVYIQGSRAWRCRQIQGEDSPLEVVIDSAVEVSIDLMLSNGPGITNRNGYETTMLYLSGDTYKLKFGQAVYSGGVFKNLVNDQSLLAIAQGGAGVKTDFTEVTHRAGNITEATNAKLLGPFANDAAAAAKNVPIGAAYKVTGGTIVWRQS